MNHNAFLLKQLEMPIQNQVDEREGIENMQNHHQGQGGGWWGNTRVRFEIRKNLFPRMLVVRHHRPEIETKILLARMSSLQYLDPCLQTRKNGSLLSEECLDVLARESTQKVLIKCWNPTSPTSKNFQSKSICPFATERINPCRVTKHQIPIHYRITSFYYYHKKPSEETSCPCKHKERIDGIFGTESSWARNEHRLLVAWNCECNGTKRDMREALSLFCMPWTFSRYLCTYSCIKALPKTLPENSTCYWKRSKLP